MRVEPNGAGTVPEPRRAAGASAPLGEHVCPLSPQPFLESEVVRITPPAIPSRPADLGVVLMATAGAVTGCLTSRHGLVTSARTPRPP